MAINLQSTFASVLWHFCCFAMLTCTGGVLLLCVLCHSETRKHIVAISKMNNFITNPRTALNPPPLRAPLWNDISSNRRLYSHASGNITPPTFLRVRPNNCQNCGVHEMHHNLAGIRTPPTRATGSRTSHLLARRASHLAICFWSMQTL